MANELAYYIRLSEADEETGKIKDESESISNQRALILKYISDQSEFEGWTIREYVDDGFSGANDNRPAFQRMLERIHEGSIQCIIVKDLSRFARNYILLGEYMEQIFPLLGVRFIAINDGYDSKTTTSAADSMSVVLKSVLNAYYCKELSHKIRATAYLKMQKHEFLGIPPFGYVYNEDHTQYLIDPDAAMIVRHAFDLALSGKSRTEIASDLNANGYPTIAEYNQLQRKARKSNIPIPDLPRWDVTKVVNLLRNPVYKGTLVCRKRTVIIPSSHKTRKTDPSEQYVFDDSHEAIVTAEEFDQVQVRFPHQERKAPRKLNDYPLRSVVFCGVCKRAMHRYQLARGDDGARYYCRSAQLTNTPCTNTKYSEKELEQIILQSLLPMLQMIQASVGHRRSNQDQVQTMLGQCQQELREAGATEKKLRLEKLEIYEAYIAGTLSVQAYRRKKNELTRRGKVISERLTQLQDQEATLKNGILPKEVAQVYDSAKAYHTATTLNRDMVSSFVERLYVFEDHCEIVWKFRDVWEQIVKSGVPTEEMEWNPK